MIDFENIISQDQTYTDINQICKDLYWSAKHISLVSPLTVGKGKAYTKERAEFSKEEEKRFCNTIVRSIGIHNLIKNGTVRVYTIESFLKRNGLIWTKLRDSMYGDIVIEHNNFVNCIDLKIGLGLIGAVSRDSIKNFGTDIDELSKKLNKPFIYTYVLVADMKSKSKYRYNSTNDVLIVPANDIINNNNLVSIANNSNFIGQKDFSRYLDDFSKYRYNS